jgi:hypothetical protein
MAAAICQHFILFYALSVGPVFAFYPYSSRLISCYRPLFRIAPSATVRYVNMWGVSDLEVFFMLQTVQRSVVR